MPIPQKNINARQVSAVRPPSVTDNSRGGYYATQTMKCYISLTWMMVEGEIL